MDFAWDPKVEAVRAEVREFLAEHLTPELEERVYRSGVSHDDDFVRAVGERNWIAPEWSREGFDALDAFSAHAILDELTKADAPMYAVGTSVMVARVIRAVGSAGLRAAIVPKVVTGELTIALGMSEPEGGSDVAAVRTRARRVDGGWVIDGQKMFTTNGHVCDYVFLLARTDPTSERHRGLTTFLVPLDTAGFEAQGVFTVSGERTNITFYNELFLEDRWRISEVGAGWQSLMLALQDEHSAAFSPHLDRLLAATETWVARPGSDGSTPLEREDVRRALIRAATDLEVAQLLEVRASYMESVGDVPVAEGPMSKLFSTEAMVRHAEALTAVVGPEALRSRLDPTAISAGLVEHSLRYSLGMTIYGGTSEIQRNIIAQRRCGLPRP